MRIRTETHIWSTSLEYMTLGCLALNETTISHLSPPKAQGSLWRWQWEDHKGQRPWMTMRKLFYRFSMATT